MEPLKPISIPVLTEIIRNVPAPQAHDIDAVLAEVQTKLAARTFKLADDIMRSAFAELEATLFEQISGRLREQLPIIIDATLREYLDPHNDR
jgi:uncharacterized protein (DUF2267 family)